MKTKSLTILFSDMAGFTSLTASHSRKQIANLLDTQDSIVREAIREFKGEVVKSMGDGFIATFESPTNAVLSAMKIQEKVASHNATTPSRERFWLRVAINSGEVTLKNGDVFGEPVNVASRVMSQGEPGEVYLTEAVYLAMNRNEIPIEELGSWTLKGLKEPILIYKVVKNQLELIKARLAGRKNALKRGLVLALPKNLKRHFYQVAVLASALLVFSSLLSERNESVLGKFDLGTPTPSPTPTPVPTPEPTPKVIIIKLTPEPTPIPTETPSPTPEKQRGRSND